ncbi:MAG: response regulator [bacterium]
MQRNIGSGKNWDSEVGVIVIAPAPAGAAGQDIRGTLAGLPRRASGAVDDGDNTVNCRDFLDSIHDGGFITDLAGNITATNLRCCALLGVSADNLKRLRIHSLVSGADESLMATVKMILERKRYVRIEADLLRSGGSAFSCELEAGAVAVGGRRRVLYVMRPRLQAARSGGADKAATSEAKVLKRVETAATVAGQIAHDFDNLLTPLFAYPDLIRRDLPEKCRGRELLEIMEKTAHDMSKITQQLLALSKRGRHKMCQTNINEIATRVAAMLHDMASERNIEIATDLASDLLLLSGASEQLLRVIQNLCQNAMDAIDGAGRIEISTRNVFLDRIGEGPEDPGAGEYIELKVSDNGHGIPEDVIEKIFDPFFTTRRTAKSRGSGLGLSVVRGVVDDHHGSIAVRSAVGKGTCFTLLFPACREESSGAVSTHSEKGATVLIIDDDAHQRDIVARLFQFHDYKVKCLPSGETGLTYMAECAATGSHGEEKPAASRFPDLVILDVVMDPGMDGNETCKRMLEINPRQRIIMVSGFPSAVSAGVKSVVANVSYLGKPLTWQGISRALAHLESAGGRTDARKSLVPRKGNRILVVDDEEGIRRLFHMILASAFPKADVEVAGNGADAVAAFKDGHHSVIIMDLRMPLMSGDAAFLKIQEHCLANNWAQPNVVFCTGFAPPDVVKKIVASGCGHSMLTKPVSGDALVAATGEHLSDET